MDPKRNEVVMGRRVNQAAGAVLVLVLVLVAAALVSGWGVSQAIAQQAGTEEQAPPQEAASLGPLAPFLLYGQEADSPWIGETDGNGYRLINPDAPDAITYFFVGSPPETHGKRTAEIKTVILQGDGKAGLLYGYQQEPRQYHLFVVDAQGTATIFHRPPEGGLNELMSTQLQDPDQPDDQPAGPKVVTLKLVEDGNSLTAFINDTQIGQLQTPHLGRGDIGIAAAGLIDGLFLDFKLQNAGQ